MFESVVQPNVWDNGDYTAKAGFATDSAPKQKSLEIYVMSRLPDLAEKVMELYPRVLRSWKIKIHNISVEEDFDPAFVAKAEILITEPEFLGKNNEYFPALKWAHSTKANVACLYSYMLRKPAFKITRHGSLHSANLIAKYVLSHIVTSELRSHDKFYYDSEESMLGFKFQRKLSNLTVGILGVGHVAQAVNACLKPFKMRRIALARTINRRSYFCLFNEVTFSLERVLSNADYIINTLPNTYLATGMLCLDDLKSCKRKPTLINAGSCCVIDEENLVKAIDYKWIRRVVLDESDKEEFPGATDMWEMPEVVVTEDREAGITTKDVAASFIKTLVYYLQDESLPYEHNWHNAY